MIHAFALDSKKLNHELLLQILRNKEFEPVFPDGKFLHKASTRAKQGKTHSL
jgi:hypothetical protein